MLGATHLPPTDTLDGLLRRNCRRAAALIRKRCISPSAVAMHLLETLCLDDDFAVFSGRDGTAFQRGFRCRLQVSISCVSRIERRSGCLYRDTAADKGVSFSPAVFCSDRCRFSTCRKMWRTASGRDGRPWLPIQASGPATRSPCSPVTTGTLAFGGRFRGLPRTVSLGLEITN
jgi:hypothetical protein